MTTSSKPLTGETIHETLWNLAAKHSGQDRSQLRPTSRLSQDLGADSLTVTELAMELEEQLDLSLPDEIWDKPNLTLGDLEQAIVAHIGK